MSTLVTIVNNGYNLSWRYEKQLINIVYEILNKIETKLNRESGTKFKI